MKTFTTRQSRDRGPIRWLRMVAVFGIAGSMLLGSTAIAEMISAGAPPEPPEDPPALELRINSKGNGPPFTINPAGNKIGPNKFKYQGSKEHGKWTATWDIEVDPDPFVFGTFTLYNPMPFDQDFQVSAYLPIEEPMTEGTLTGGSFSGTLIDLNSDGATLTVHSDEPTPPMYTAKIDGIDWYYLNVPTPVNTVPSGTESSGPADFGVPIPSLPGPNCSESIEIETNVRVSAHDYAVVVATFVVEPIPEPATVGMLVSGLVVAAGFGL